MIKKLEIDMQLDSVRENLIQIMTDESIQFVHNNLPLSIHQENQFTCKDVINEKKEIYLVKSDTTLIINNEVAGKIIIVIVDNEQKLEIEIEETQLLEFLREKLTYLIKQQFLFVYDNSELELVDEKKIQIIDIIEDDTVNVQTIAEEKASQQSFKKKSSSALNGQIDPTYHPSNQNVVDQDEEEKENFQSFSLINEVKEPITKFNNLDNINKTQNSSSPNQAGMNDYLSQKKQQYLARLFEETVYAMPLCAERCLQKLLYYIACKIILPQTIFLQDMTVLEKINIDEEIQNEFRLFNIRLADEGHQNEIQDQVNEAIINVTAENWKGTYNLLYQIFNQIKVLNIYEIKDLIKKSEIAAELVKNKSIILILGSTGSGKSSLIHKLAGSTMVQVLVNGLNHIQPTDIINSMLKTVSTSPFSESETRYINPVEVEYKSVGSYNIGSVTLVDSPGFEDTNGFEVDIAGSIGITKAICECESVRPVILISYQNKGNRMEGVKEMAHLLANMIPELSEYFRSFTYVFTKYPKKERDCIFSQIKDVIDKMTDNEKNDTNFYKLFVDMMQQADGNDVIAIDLINDVSGRILDKISRKPTIQRPSEVFNTFISKRSQAAINIQTQKHQLLIQRALKREDDQKLIKYKLDEINYLASELNQEFAKQVYNECLKDVKQFLVQNFEDFQNEVKKGLSQNNTLSQEDIDNIQSRISLQEKFDQLINENLKNEAPKFDAFNLYLDEQIKKVIQQVKDTDIIDPQINQLLGKLKLVANYFEKYNQSFVELCSFIQQKLEDIAKIYQQYFTEDDFDASAKELQKYQKAIQIVGEFQNEEYLENKLENMISQLLEYLTNIAQCQNKILEHAQLSEKELNELEIVSQQLSKANIAFMSINTSISKQIFNISKSFNELLFKKFIMTVQQIDLILQEKDQKAFRQIESLFKQLNSLHKIQSIESSTSDIYYKTLENLKGIIEQQKRDMESLMDKLKVDQQNDFSIYSRLSKCLDCLKYAEWIEQYKTGVYTDAKIFIDEQIVCHVNSKNEVLSALNIDIENPNQIQQVANLITEIEGILILQDHIPQVKDSIEKAVKNFKDKLSYLYKEETLYYIGQEKDIANIQTLNYQRIQNSIIFLQKCSSIKHLDQLGSIPLLMKIQQLLANYGSRNKNKWNEIIIQLQQKGDGQNTVQFEGLANKMYDYFDEIRLISDKYQIIYQYYDSKQTQLRIYQKQLSILLEDLNEDMKKFQKTNQLNMLIQKLEIVKTLRIMDDFLPNAQNFWILYKEYQDKYYDNVTVELQLVIKDIKCHNYTEVLNALLKLKQMNDQISIENTKKVKVMLNKQIQELINETQLMAIKIKGTENIKEDKIYDIVKNLNKLSDAEQLSEYMNPVDVIAISIKRIKLTISKGMMEFMKQIESSIKNNSFFEAKQDLQRFDVICELLGNYCEEQVIEAIQQLQKQQNVSLKVIIDQFKSMEIEKYLSNRPKEIFEKLQKGQQGDYNTTLNQIEDIILQKLRDRLILIQNSKNTLQTHLLRQLESIINTLPEKIKTIIDDEIQATKEIIAAQLKEKEYEIKNALDNDNIQELNNKIKQCIQENDTKMKSLIRDHINQKILNIKFYIAKHIDEAFDEVLVSNLVIFNKYITIQKLYSLQENKSDIKDILQMIVQKGQQQFNSIEKLFSQEIYDNGAQSSLKNQNDSYINDPQSLEENIKLIIWWIIKYLEFKQENPSILQEMVKKIDQMLISTFRIVDESLLKNQATFNKYISQNNLDINQINCALNNIKKWDTIFNLRSKQEILQQIKKLLQQDTKINHILQDGLTYSNMKDKTSIAIKNLEESFILNAENPINDRTNNLEVDRNKYYTNLNENLQLLTQLHLLSNHSIRSINNESKGENYIHIIESKLYKLIDDAKLILLDTALLKNDCQNFNVLYINITSMVKSFVFRSGNFLHEKNDIDKKFIHKINQIQQQATDEQSIIDNFSKTLIKLQEIAINVPNFKNICGEKIEQSIDSYKTKFGAQNIAKLGFVLDKNALGKIIISEHKALEGFDLHLLTDKMSRHGIKYVLENVSGDNIDKTKLLNRYQEYLNKNQQLIKTFLSPSMDLKVITSNLRALIEKNNINKDTFQFCRTIKEVLPELLAYICAIWTIMNAKYYFEASGVEKQENYLIRPHAAQIISIFRMFGIGDPKEVLVNNLVQIGTGEGKSITLGISSVLFALLGFDVNCACYSGYLSARDKEQFRPLFEHFNLEKYIQYGTFNKICETIINQNGDVRKIVENVITGKQLDIRDVNQQKRPKILLVDEVDVFFSKDFYGNTYGPLACIRDPTITDLITQIWNQRSQKKTIDQVKAFPQYKLVCEKFKEWEQLIENSVKNMIQDVDNFQTPEYIVQSDRIGYKEQDSVAFNISYGYKTIFAYCNEQEKGTISKTSLENNICIEVNIGQFSFAEIPAQFKYIMGVTGTLATLSDSEKDVIKKEYNIMKHTYIPSVFGKNSRTFQPKYDCKVENSDDYYNTIVSEINERLIGIDLQNSRAVLIFFEDKISLEQFYNSPAYNLLRAQTKYLTEEASIAEKESIIKQSTLSGAVTLFTKCFGRGTDFISRDELVKNNRGIHVILAFLPEDYSEEVQIMGRTARQGEKGSFSIVILDKSLEKFLITIQQLQDNKGDHYKILNEKRNIYFNDQYQNNKEYILSAKKMHEETQKLLESIKINKIAYVKKFLLSRNKGAEVASISRTIILMDGTGSMSGLIHKAKNQVATMFDRAYQILNENGLKEGCFQLLFAIYRSYNEHEKDLLEASGWEIKPENLRLFTERVQAKGGWGEESVEIGLQYANIQDKIEPVSQVILIGDAPPTPVAEVIKRRKRKGQAYWNTTKFVESTDYVKESIILQAKNIKVHAFFVNKWAEPSFREIATMTSGNCEFLDVNSPAGAEMLTGLVTEAILRNIGQNCGKGDTLVNQYQNRFGKGIK